MKKMNKMVLAVSLILSVLVFYQCTNNEDLFSSGSGVNTFTSLEEIHDSLTSNDTIVLTIADPTIDITLEGSQGTVFNFPANSIVTESASPVVPPLTLTLIEIYKRGDMIKNNIQTFAAEMPLVSTGMFYLQGTDANGNILNLSGGNAVLPYQTDATGYEINMQYFVGADQNAPSGSVVSWVEGDADVSFDETAGEFTIGGILAGWSNCDAYYELVDGSTTQFSVRVNNATDYVNTKVFFALNDFSTVAALTSVNNDENALTTYTGSIPTGSMGKLIAISLIDGELYFASQDVTVAGDDLFEMEVQAGSIAQLETLLDALN